MAHDIFISYAVKDESVADEISRTLESQGIRCWYAPRDVPYGEDFEDAIIDAISASRLMIVVISPEANESTHVKREVQYARSEDTKVPILPFLIKKVSLSNALRYYIGSAQRMNASTPPLERHLERLARYVRQRLSDGESSIVQDEQAADAVSPGAHLTKEGRAATPAGDAAPTKPAVEERGPSEKAASAAVTHQAQAESPRVETLSGAETPRDETDRRWLDKAWRLFRRGTRRVWMSIVFPDWAPKDQPFLYAGIVAFLAILVIIGLAAGHPEWFSPGESPTPTPAPRPTPTPEAWALKYSFRKEGSFAASVKFLPGGKTCVVKPGDKTVRLLEVYTGKSTLLATSESSSQGLATLASPDGSTLAGWETAAATGSEIRIMVWDIATATLKTTLPGHVNSIHGVVFSNDGKMLLSTGDDAGMKLWDTQTGALKLQVQGVKTVNSKYGTPMTLFLTESRFADDGSTLAIYTSGRDRAVRLYDARTGAQKRTLPSQPKAITYVSFTPNSKGIVTDDGSDLRMYDVETGVLKQTIAGNGQSSPVFGYSSDETTIVTRLSENKTASVYDAVTGVFRYSLSGTTSTEFSPDGKLLISAGEDKLSKLLDAQTGKPKFAYPGTVRFLPDGKTFANWESGGGVLRLRDAQTGEERRAVALEGMTIGEVRFSPDSKVLLVSMTLGYETTALLYDAQTGALRQTIKAERGLFRLFSPGGKTLATWVSATGKGQPPKGKSPTPTPDEARPRRVMLWDSSIDWAQQVLEGEENVRDVIFSSDGGAVLVLRQTSIELWVRNPPPGTETSRG